MRKRDVGSEEREALPAEGEPTVEVRRPTAPRRPLMPVDQESGPGTGESLLDDRTAATLIHGLRPAERRPSAGETPADAVSSSSPLAGERDPAHLWRARLFALAALILAMVVLLVLVLAR